MMLYFHNHKSKDCSHVDTMLMNDVKLVEATNQDVLWYGLNTNTDHGQQVMKSIKPESLPHISIIVPDENKHVYILVTLEGTDKIMKNLVREIRKAKIKLIQMQQSIEEK